MFTMIPLNTPTQNAKQLNKQLTHLRQNLKKIKKKTSKNNEYIYKLGQNLIIWFIDIMGQTLKSNYCQAFREMTTCNFGHNQHQRNRDGCGCLINNRDGYGCFIDSRDGYGCFINNRDGYGCLINNRHSYGCLINSQKS